MKQFYYYVWVVGHLRCEKAESPTKACMQAFGTIYSGPPHDSCLVKNVGGRKPAYMSQKMQTKLHTDPNGWTTPQGYELSTDTVKETWQKHKEGVKK